jgi:uncharacterized protein YihD (DUF1040 family)
MTEPNIIRILQTLWEKKFRINLVEWKLIYIFVSNKKTKIIMVNHTTKDSHLKGRRIRLINMEDPNPIPSGTEGTIEHVDDLNQYHVKWDNGSTLAVIPEVDKFEII